jgi:hypothetical protein
LCYARPLIGLLRLLIVEIDGVQVRAHEGKSCADEHGDGERNESIPHQEKKRGTMLRKRGKGGGRRSEVASMQVKSRNGADGLECNCWNVLGRCVRSYMSVRW